MNEDGDLLPVMLCSSTSSDTPGQPLEKMMFTDYDYHSHVIDKGGANDPQFDVATVWGGTFSGLDHSAPAQVGGYWWYLSAAASVAPFEYDQIAATYPGIFDSDVPIGDYAAALQAYDPKTGQAVDPGSLGNGGSNTIYRLRDGIERFMITDINNPGASAKAQSEIVVQSDEVATEMVSFNHVPGGANVMFMDGHVEFIKYPSDTFPVTRGFAVLYGQFARNYVADMTTAP